MLQIESPRLRVSRRLFEQLTIENPDARLERAAGGTLVIVPPAGSGASRRNASLNFQLMAWNEANRLGVVFESNGAFELPDGSIRAADAAWIVLERWQRLTEAEQEAFAPLCPDFVVELRSPGDRLADLREKMSDYLANGARLGWLIDPYQKSVEIYRPDCRAEVLPNPLTVSGDNVLPGFVLKLAPIFNVQV